MSAKKFAMPQARILSNDTRKRSCDPDQYSSGVPKRRRTIRDLGDGVFSESDAYCWLCHEGDDGGGCCCETCPRLFHFRCLHLTSPPPANWVCPECQNLLKAESLDTQPQKMCSVSVQSLSVILKHVLNRLKTPETKPFHQPVDCGAVPLYTDYVFKPMDFNTIDKNIKKLMYSSVEAFIADVKWIVHNCIVFNGKGHPLTSVAKQMLKMCIHETTELQICADCYLNSCVQEGDDWFCEPCRIPHTLVWAKMKGYPFWPAKVLRADGTGQVDVRFFGEHDRAWVSVSQVFLMSENPPSLVPRKTKGFEEARIEMNKHISLLRHKFGSFTFSPDRTPYMDNREEESAKKKDNINNNNSSTGPNTSGYSTFDNSFSNTSTNNNISFFGDVSFTGSAAGDGAVDSSSGGNSVEGSRRSQRSKLVLKINKKHLLNKQVYISRGDEDDEEEGEVIDGDDAKNDSSLTIEEVDLAGDELLETAAQHHNNNENNKNDNTHNNIININNASDNNKEMTITTIAPDSITDNDPGNKSADNAAGVRSDETNDKSENNGGDGGINKNNNIEDNNKNNNCGDDNTNNNNSNNGDKIINTADNKSIDKEIINTKKDNIINKDDNIGCNEATSSRKKSSCTDVTPAPQLINDVLETNEPRDPLLVSSTDVIMPTSSSTPPSSSSTQKFVPDPQDFDLNLYKNKLLSSVEDVMKDFIRDVFLSDKSNSIHSYLQSELKSLKAEVKEEIQALKHTHDLELQEVRSSYETQFSNMRKKMQLQLQEAKKKHWCTRCGNEGEMYCCWKATYCSDKCQRLHWSVHQTLCCQASEKDYMIKDHQAVSSGDFFINIIPK